MSLHDSIKELRNVAKHLDAAKFNPQINALEKFLDGVKFGKPVKPLEDVLKMLLQKFRNGDENFSAREIKNLPFIIYEPEITSHDVKKILSKLDFSRASHLRRVISAYILNYDGSNKTELLRQELEKIRKVDVVSLQKIFASRDKFFTKDCFLNMTKFFAQKSGVKDALKELGLSDFYRTANFIQTALKIFFRSNVARLENKFKLLDELDADFDVYKNIFPPVADALIQSAAATGFGKKKCVEIFYRRLGDPRFGYTRFNWNSVSQKSKDIFLHWLVEEDLEIFFKIIKQTAVDGMWRYREKFWRAYLPFISNTRIFLGSDAKRIARRLGDKTMTHGNLSGGSNNQSVFVFQIGRFIFSEWSHNGKLRVHDAELAQNFFGAISINRRAIDENFIAAWIHSSPQTYFWQRAVSDWLEKNCGIRKTQVDWGL